jgi:UDP-glucose 4-epimerase
MVVPTLIRQALAGRPLTVHGDGRQTRSFTDVSDAVAGTYALATHPAAVGEVFNVGNDREVSIVELAERVKKLTSSDSPIVFVPYAKVYGEGYEDLRRRVADISRASRLVRYCPRIGLDQTLTAIAEAERAAGAGSEVPSLGVRSRPALVGSPQRS